MKKVLTLKDLDFKINSISVKDALIMQKKSLTMNTYEFYKELLLISTSLDEQQVLNIFLPDVFSILTEHLLENFNNENLSTELTPKDLLHNQPEYKEEIYNIGDYRFSLFNLTLAKAIECEKYCYLKNDTDFLTFYLMAGTCLKGLKEGIDTLLNSDVTDTRKNEIKNLNRLLSESSYVKVDFLINTSNISLVSETNKYITIKNSFFFSF